MATDGKNESAQQDLGDQVHGQQHFYDIGRAGQRRGELGIWRATIRDLPQLVMWGREFHAESPWSDMPFNMSDLADTFLAAMNSDRAYLAVSDHGFILGYLDNVFFNKDAVFAREALWWAKSNGKPLLDSFEAWALDNGATSVIIGHPAYEDQRKNETLGRLFTRRGYKPIERHMVKVL